MCGSSIVTRTTKVEGDGAAERTLQLSAYDVLGKDLSSVPKHHGWFTITCTGDPTSLTSLGTHNREVWPVLKREGADPRENCRQPLENGKNERRGRLMGQSAAGHGKNRCLLEGFGCVDVIF